MRLFLVGASFLSFPPPKSRDSSLNSLNLIKVKHRLFKSTVIKLNKTKTPVRLRCEGLMTVKPCCVHGHMIDAAAIFPLDAALLHCEKPRTKTDQRNVADDLSTLSLAVSPAIASLTSCK